MFSCSSWSCWNQASSSGSKDSWRGSNCSWSWRKETNELFADEDACASAVQYIAVHAESLSGEPHLVTNVEMAHQDYRVNTKDTHRSDWYKSKPKTKKTTQKLLIRRIFDILQRKLMVLQWISWNATAQWTYSNLKFWTPWVTRRMWHWLKTLLPVPLRLAERTAII